MIFIQIHSFIHVICCFLLGITLYRTKKTWNRSHFLDYQLREFYLSNFESCWSLWGKAYFLVPWDFKYTKIIISKTSEFMLHSELWNGIWTIGSQNIVEKQHQFFNVVDISKMAIHKKSVSRHLFISAEISIEDSSIKVYIFLKDFQALSLDIQQFTMQQHVMSYQKKTVLILSWGNKGNSYKRLPIHPYTYANEVLVKH